MAMNSEHDRQEWSATWDARVVALQSLFGEVDDRVGHSPVPFDFGPEAGGAADVVYFRHNQPGVIAVTAELLGRSEQPRNILGNYELAVCHREDDPWGPNIISRLAHYTLDQPLNPGETMSLASAVPKGSSVAAFLFFDFGRFDFLGNAAGVLLCVGITAQELAACRVGRLQEVQQLLRSKGIYPYTDLLRPSVVP